MKKNLALRLGAVVLVMSIISLSLVSGTFAKYTKGVTGSEEVRAAKFAFNLVQNATNVGNQASDVAIFDIFDYTDTGVYGDGENGEKEFIAPGTGGEFTIDVQNLSEVAVDVSFELTEVNGDHIPIYYTLTTEAGAQRYSSALTGISYGGTEYGTLTELATAIAAGDPLDATNGTDPETATYTLYWHWAYELPDTVYQEGLDNDAVDTALGIDDTPPTVELSVKAIVTQVDDIP